MATGELAAVIPIFISRNVVNFLSMLRARACMKPQPEFRPVHETFATTRSLAQTLHSTPAFELHTQQARLPRHTHAPC